MPKVLKNLVITVILGCVVFVIGSAFFGGFEFESSRDFFISFGFYQLYAFVLGFSNMYYFDYLEKQTWNSTNGLSIKRLVIGIVGSIVITLIGLVILRMLTAVYISNLSFQDFIANESYRNYSFGLWITLSIVITFHAFYFFARLQQEKVKEQQVIAGTASAKFDALKNQLDPHFLFNSLNVLTSLIEENPDNAQKFTTALSKIYRYVLEQKNKDLISVDEELAFAKTYMSLLKMRFEDSIIFEIPEQATNPESKVVPLSLQLLLENAVKHNMVTTRQPLYIKIYEDRGNLVVENNLQPKQIVKKSSGVGLENIKQRYALLTQKKVTINQEAQRFAVAIPMLTKKIKTMDQFDRHTDKDAYDTAKKHVREIKEFYNNLVSYMVVIPFLIFINYTTGWSYQWFWYPMFGWGMGVVIHGFSVFGYGKRWEQRKIKEFLDKENQLDNWK